MTKALTLAALLLCGAIAAAAGQDQAPPVGGLVPSGEGMPDGPGKDVVVKICGVCHETRRTASLRLTREGWSGVIEDMVHRGAKGTDAELAQVLDYLAANFLGEAQRALNVNTASAIDLETVAGLLRKEAAAVLEYRDKNGPFKTLDDMKKVPGLDFKKIDSRREYLVAIQ